MSSIKSELIALLEKHAITTPRQLMDANWEYLVKILKDFDAPSIRSYLGIPAYGPLKDHADAKKGLIVFIWGADVADEMIYEIVAKQYLGDITDGLEGVAKLSKVNAKEIGNLLGLKKIDMNTAFCQQIIAAALVGKEGVDEEKLKEEVKVARNMNARKLEKQIAVNKLKRNYNITDANELAKVYKKQKEAIDNTVRDTIGGYSIDVGDIIEGVYETTPRDTVKDQLILLDKYKASVIFEEFDAIYPQIQDLLASVYPHVKPGDQDSIKNFISWLKLDLTTEAEESRTAIISKMALDDLSDMTVFWARPDVSKVVRYLYDHEEITTGSYQKKFFQKTSLSYLLARKNDYLATMGKNPLQILLSYEKIQKKAALWNLYTIVYDLGKGEDHLTLHSLKRLISSPLQIEHLKDELQTAGCDTIEKKRAFCQQKL